MIAAASDLKHVAKLLQFHFFWLWFSMSKCSSVLAQLPKNVIVRGSRGRQAAAVRSDQNSG
jgi:hypothetical protein